MRQLGQEGLCLIWAVNNALGQRLLTKESVFRLLAAENRRDRRHNSRYYIARDGIDFKSFKKVIKEGFGVYLKRVKTYRMTGNYLLTYDFHDYLHTIAMRDGEVIDSRKHQEITSLDTDRKLVDVYKVIRS
jgi:hypothetical protein